MKQALIDLKDCKILVVDDVPANLDIIVRVQNHLERALFARQRDEVKLYLKRMRVDCI